MNVAAAVNVLSSTSSAFGTASSTHIDEKLQKQLLAEEEQAMQKYKVRELDPEGNVLVVDLSQEFCLFNPGFERRHHESFRGGRWRRRRRRRSGGRRGGWGVWRGGGGGSG